MNVNFGSTVSLKQAAQLIVACPEVRFFLQGEPGIGKTALLNTIGQMLPDYDTAYIDVPNLDLGDICMPVMDHEDKVTRYYPNARFGVHTGRKTVMLFDEFPKGTDPVKNMLHPAINEGRLGDVEFNPANIIIMTGNLASDGVGDFLKAHTKNRISILTVRKPTADEWIEWGVNHDIDPTLLAFASQYPHIFASYTDPGQADNLYIYQPKRNQTSFFSPRSGAKASHIVKRRKSLDPETVIAALTGTCGEAFARDFQAYMEFADQLPAKELVLASPTTAPVPTSPAAQSIVVYGALSWVEKDTLPKFMKYIERFPTEWQAVFAVNLAKSSKQALAFTTREFSEWVAKNQDVL
jgi:hypothetical protein